MVAIMSLLVGGWRVYARRYAREVSRRNGVRVTAAIVAFLEARLNEFASDVGRYPTTAEGLDVLVRQPSGLPGWKGPYVKSPAPDVWGNPYTYTETGGAYRVGSPGPDGRPGTPDDIVRSGPPAGSP